MPMDWGLARDYAARDDDTEEALVTEAEWLATPHLYHKIDSLERQAGNDRRLRLFACACCRRAWDLLQVDAARRIVELSEAYADGEATEAELQLANSLPEFAGLDALYEREDRPEATVQLSACVVDALEAARCLASSQVDILLVVQNTSRVLAHDFIRSSQNFQMGRSPGHDEAEFAEKEKLLRDIFGNPFRPTPVAAPPWLRWNGGTVQQLALVAYQHRGLPEGMLDPVRLAALADALEDAGCTDADLLGHLRGPGPHVRGCWAVDLVLGKN
jgi:hypothetical protein